MSASHTIDELRVGQFDADTAKIQGELWDVVARVAGAQPTPIVSLVVAGMNDVLNAQGYTQAAWWNRIPIAAWMLMVLIAIACNLLVGYSEHRTTGFLLILPLVISTALFLIADIDSPRRGIIRVQPHNLMSQCQAMKPTRRGHRRELNEGNAADTPSSADRWDRPEAIR